MNLVKEFTLEQKLFMKNEIAKLEGTHTIEVSPKLAQRWLELNSGNRPLSYPNANEYVGRMERGEWKLNGQTIVFSNDGILRDGQHRLYAVTLYGKPVKFDVKFGIEPEAFTTIDDGKKRSLADIINISGIECNESIVSGASKLVVAMQLSWRANNIGTSRKKPSNLQMLNWVKENRPIIDFSNKAKVWSRESGKIISATEFAAFGFVFGERNHEKSVEFMSKLASGLDIGKDSVVYKLRTRLIADKGNVMNRMKSSYRRAIIIKAWNFFIKGQNVQRLRYKPDSEAFPQPV